jgi:hypothetical protein
MNKDDFDPHDKFLNSSSFGFSKEYLPWQPDFCMELNSLNNFQR